MSVNMICCLTSSFKFFNSLSNLLTYELLTFSPSIFKVLGTFLCLLLIVTYLWWLSHSWQSTFPLLSYLIKLLIIIINGRLYFFNSNYFLYQNTRTQSTISPLTLNQVDLPRFYERVEGGKPVVFYEILVKIGSRDWQLEKRYNAFS